MAQKGQTSLLRTWNKTGLTKVEALMRFKRSRSHQGQEIYSQQAGYICAVDLTNAILTFLLASRASPYIILLFDHFFKETDFLLEYSSCFLEITS